MRKITIDNPPNPDTAQYKTNPLAYNRAVYNWMSAIKSKIELASAINDTPLNQNFVVSSFTTNTSLAGSSTTTDIANFVCTLIAAMTKKGIITVSTAT